MPFPLDGDDDDDDDDDVVSQLFFVFCPPLKPFPLEGSDVL